MGSVIYGLVYAIRVTAHGEPGSDQIKTCDVNERFLVSAPTFEHLSSFSPLEAQA